VGSACRPFSVACASLFLPLRLPDHLRHCVPPLLPFPLPPSLPPSLPPAPGVPVESVGSGCDGSVWRGVREASPPLAPQLQPKEGRGSQPSCVSPLAAAAAEEESRGRRGVVVLLLLLLLLLLLVVVVVVVVVVPPPLFRLRPSHWLLRLPLVVGRMEKGGQVGLSLPLYLFPYRSCW